MKLLLASILLLIFCFQALAQEGVITVIEGIKVKDGKKAEALYYYNNNWFKLREAAIEKKYIYSFELVEIFSPETSGFDLALVTRFANREQYDKREEYFTELIANRGELKLLNDLKPGDFRESVVVATFTRGPFEFAGFRFTGASEKRIKLENEGWELIGDLTLPLFERPLPAVILLNKAYGSRDAYKGLAKKLAENGIASLRIDLRAHGESSNKGKFGPPFDEKMRALLEGSDRDIKVIQEWLGERPEIDDNRIGILGASYSGEEMVRAARNGRFAKAYVALSPGSFSEESAKSIDMAKVPWLFVRSVDEIALMKDVFSMIRENSKTSRILEVSGKKHASDILLDQPDVEDVVALWFKQNL